MSTAWPQACEAQGWDRNNRALRLRVLSIALGRDIESASEMMPVPILTALRPIWASQRTIWRKPSRVTTRKWVPPGGSVNASWTLSRCLKLYHPNPHGYLQTIIFAKFGNKAQVVELDCLTDDPIIDSTGKVHPSELDQVLWAMSRGVHNKRKAAHHSLHEMYTAAQLPCACAFCRKQQSAVVQESAVNPF
jgi:hypothetical protein